MTGTAGPALDVGEGLGVFSRGAVREGIGAWGIERVTGDARLRLYHASVGAHYILDPDATIEVRRPVTL
jgi:hypothetical protein